MMRKLRLAMVALIVLAALLPLAFAQAACLGGYPDGKCEVGDVTDPNNCGCSDCWGLNPPAAGGGGVCDSVATTAVCMALGSTAPHKCQVSPSWYKPEVERVAGSWTVWGPIAAVAVLVAFLISALAYMLGIGFDLPELRMWAKSELFHALANAVLVAGLVMLVTVMTDEGFAKILGQNINPFNLAYGYLVPLADQLKTLYTTNYNINYPVEAFASLATYSNATGNTTYLLFFLKALLVEPLHLANHYVIQALILTYFQIELLNFFQQTAFATLLPLGIFLRIFPFTRGTGGVLIAMAIGLFLVYPTMFGFISMMTEDEQALRAAMSGDTGSSVGVDMATYNACEHDVEGAANAGEAAADPAVISKISEYYSFLPPIVMKILFYPIIVFAVTFTFIKIASPLLGSDISELGQGLVKLI